MVSTILVVDLVTHEWISTFCNMMNRINHELTIRVDEIWNHELINKKQYNKLTLQELNAQNVCIFILKDKKKYQ